MFHLLSCIITLFLLFLTGSCKQLLSEPPLELTSNIIFSNDFNIHDVPKMTSGAPLQVNFSIHYLQILNVDQIRQILSLDISMSLIWRDPRISFCSTGNISNYVTFNPKEAEYFWIPDIFIDKARSVRSPQLFVEPAFLRIYNNSILRLSNLLNFDITCEMDFHHFPFDEQLCVIKFESYGLTNNEITFFWIKGDNKFNKNASLTQFLSYIQFVDVHEAKINDLIYPGALLKIHLKREIRYHMLVTYIPSMIFVTQAWLSLFITPECISGRVAIGMTNLLSLTAMFSSVREHVPKVSYVSYLDIWIVSCILFVFASIFEFSIVSYFINRAEKSLGETIERYSRVVMLISIIIFNIRYWNMLFTHK